MKPDVTMMPLAVLAVLCVLAAWSDWRERRIANWLVLLTAAAGLSQAALGMSGPTPLWSFALHGGVALVGGMLVFALRWIGGGDAKFYAALACWFPFGQAPRLLLAVALSGLVLLVVWFIGRRLQGKKVSTGKTGPAAQLPYGIAIGLGGLLTFAT